MTEVGLYRLLGMSRKPVARAFQKWVAKVVKEIRLTGKHELEARVAQSSALIEATEAEARQLLEAKEAELLRSREELQRYREKTYDPVPTDEIVYVNKEVAELSSDRHKVGITIDERKRQSQLNTGSAQGSKMIFRVETNNAKLVETVAAHVLRRYHCGREHYNCRVEHTIDVIRVAAAVCDTLASTYEHMTAEELYDRVTAAVAEVLHESVEPKSESDEPESEWREDVAAGADPRHAGLRGRPRQVRPRETR